jgi:putative FmdB family regulatory protein
MPTYGYRCASCGHEFEAVQKFSDAPLSTCPECGEHVRRVFHPVGIVFKGSGWYVNDSRGGDKSGGDGKKAPADSAKPAAEPAASDKPAAEAASTSTPAATPAPASAD